jgi:hypothetical protein
MNRFPSPLTLLLSRHTRRRDVIALLAGASAWPTAAQAQQRILPTIGFLGTAVPSTMSEWTAALEQRLRELGWVEGRTVTIAYRWAESRLERYVEIAAEFVRLNVDVIVTTVPAAPAAKQATSVIPIVFILASDPVGTGLVASLAPGRQHHRALHPGDRPCQQAGGASARSRPGPEDGRDPGQH